MINWLTANHDALESLAAIATAFALLVQLPAFLIARFIAEREKRRERSHLYVQDFTTASDHQAREARRVLRDIGNMRTPSLNSISDIDRSSVLKLITDYELVALNVRLGRLDENILKLWMNNLVIRDWEMAAPLIQGLRTSNRALFSHWEWLAKRWS